MAGNLRDIRELEAEIESVDKWGLTKQHILDALQSQSKVAGTMSVTDGADPGQAFTISGGWNRIDVWERSIDTRGVRDGLADATDPGGWYHISNAAAGDYTVAVTLRCHVSDAGDYEIRVAVVDNQDPPNTTNTPYHDKITAVAESDINLCIASGIIKDMGVNVDSVRKRRLQIELRGPNGSIVTVLYGQFGVSR